MKKCNSLFFVIFIIYFNSSAQNIGVDVNNVKFTRDNNGLGFSNSFLNDKENPSPDISFEEAIILSGVKSLRFPLGAIGDNYLWHTPGTYNQIENGLTPRIDTREVAPGTPYWNDYVNADGTF
ncbi:MAG: hypothetical protein ACOCVN_00100 [bacterium]